MKKYIIMFLFVITIIFLTLHNVCSANIVAIIKDVTKNINILYIFILFAIIAVYFILQGLYTKVILKSLNTHISLIKGVFYSMVEFYFSGITPSSTAGQPMQVYFMAKDKIPLSNIYITLILNTIFFKIIVVILALWVLIFYNSNIFGHSTFYTIFFFLGLIFDLIMILVCYLLLYNQKLIKKLFGFTIKVGNKIPFFRRKLEKVELDKILEKYKNQIGYISTHKLEVVLTFFVTFIQRIILLSVAYVVYRGLGFNTFTYFELLAIQVAVQVTIEAFPIPGGTGLSENMYKDLFLSFFGVGVAEVGMIFTRLFNYYIPLLLTGFIIIGYYIYLKIKEKKNI